MEIKILEMRDNATFIPVLCVDMNPDYNDHFILYDKLRYLLRRCGYACNGAPIIGMTPLRADGSPFTVDPYQWPGPARTYRVAHEYIIKHWSDLKNGDVVDVEFILGETATPKRGGYEVHVEE